MSSLKHKTTATLVLLTLMLLIASALAVDYNPGVSKGQWVKYGNIAMSGLMADPSANQTSWMMLEVTDVSEENVTLHFTGKYKNGSDIPSGGMTCNVSTGMVNTTSGMYGYGNIFIVGKDLQQNDALPEMLPSISLKINSTETRTYAKTERTVNIVNITSGTPEIGEVNYFIVYDKSTGVLMETGLSMTFTLMPSMNMGFTLAATDTNMFAETSMTWLQDNMIYIVIAVVFIVVVVAAVLMARRGRKPTTPTTETETKKTET